MTTIDFYEILGISRTASEDEVHSAYRKAVKTAHPDAGGTSGLFRLLKEADDTLTDPTRRREYDRTIDGAAPPPKPAAPPPEPKFRSYPTYVPPWSASDFEPDPPAPSGSGQKARDAAPWVRQFDIFRPTRIDLLTVALAVALLGVHLVLSALEGGPPGESILGRLPVVGYFLGRSPDLVLALIYSFAFYIVPAMVLSRMMITPLLTRAHRHGRIPYVAAAIALGLLTLAILWSPVTWMMMLGMFAAYWALRAAWHLLRIFYF